MPTRAVRDYGVRRVGMAHAVAAVVVASAAVALIAFNAVRGRNIDIATARAWDVRGAPCPELTAAQWTARRERAPKVFDYDGTKLGRWSGNASCSDVHQKGGTGLFVDKVCQFTNPLALTVVSPAGSFYFLPGVGQPATLLIHKDVPRCVMASTYTLLSPD